MTWPDEYTADTCIVDKQVDSADVAFYQGVLEVAYFLFDILIQKIYFVVQICQIQFLQFAELFDRPANRYNKMPGILGLLTKRAAITSGGTGNQNYHRCSLIFLGVPRCLESMVLHGELPQRFWPSFPPSRCTRASLF